MASAWLDESVSIIDVAHRITRTYTSANDNERSCESVRSNACVQHTGAEGKTPSLWKWSIIWLALGYLAVLKMTNTRRR